MSDPLLCFDLGGQRYGVDLGRVREIAPFSDVLRVPATPSFLRGLLLRGELPIPVIDLGIKFGLEQTLATRRASVIVADARIDGVPAAMGILVDVRQSLVETGPAELQGLPELGAGIRLEFLRGTARVDGGVVFVLDLDRTLSATESEALRGLAADHLAQLEAVAVEEAAVPRSVAWPVAAHGDVSREEYVVFLSAGQRMALGLTEVRELLRCSSVRPVPGTRSFIRGVTNRRGQVLPVVDLAVCLGWAPTVIGARSCILVLDLPVEGSRTPVGVVVDGVLDVLALAPEQIEDVPHVGFPIGPERLEGVTRVGDAIVALLDVEHLLPSAPVSPATRLG